MIDAEAWYDMTESPKRLLKPLNKEKTNSRSRFNGKKIKRSAVALTDQQLLMATAYVEVFDLKTKKWCEFPVSGITDISFNPSVFEALVLPASEKKLAWAFVESNNNLCGRTDAKPTEDDSDDCVANKSRGLIMLLCGPPGVGKTVCNLSPFLEPLFQPLKPPPKRAVTASELQGLVEYRKCADEIHIVHSRGDR